MGHNDETSIQIIVLSRLTMKILAHTRVKLRSDEQ